MQLFSLKNKRQHAGQKILNKVSTATNPLVFTPQLPITHPLVTT